MGTDRSRNIEGCFHLGKCACEFVGGNGADYNAAIVAFDIRSVPRHNALQTSATLRIPKIRMGDKCSRHAFRSRTVAHRTVARPFEGSVPPVSVSTARKVAVR